MKKVFKVWYKPYKSDNGFLTVLVSAFNESEIKEKLVKANLIFLVGTNSGEILKIEEVKGLVILD